MKRIILLGFLYVYFFSLSLRAGDFPPDTTYNPVFSAFPELPPVNGSVMDTIYNVTITRITSYDSGWEWYPRHDYSKIQPWNADMSMYKFYSVAIYDAITHEKIRDLPNIYYSIWSNANPDIIYSFREDGVIAKYRVSTEEIDTIFTLSGFDLVKLGPGEGNIDNNDKYVALACKKDTDLVVVVFDLEVQDTVVSRTFYGAWQDGDYPHYVDWVSVSQSGNYVGIMWDHNTTSESDPFNGHYGVEIYNTTDMTFLRRLVKYGNHGDFCYSPDGNEVFTQFYGQDGTIHSYNLETGEHTVIHTHPDFGFGDAHLSCRNIKRPGWAYVSTDPQKGGLVVAVHLDGSEVVEHFGHHFSSAYNYTKSPMPVPSPDGKIVMFNSDFGDSSNPELVYVFTAQYEPAEITEYRTIDTDKIPHLIGQRFSISTCRNRGELNILDITGRDVMRIPIKGSTTRVNASMLRPGIYFITYRKRTLCVVNTAGVR